LEDSKGLTLETSFGRWRSFFWPIHRHELRKFIPMALIFFFISFNYNLLRVFKDSLVVTAKDSGAEVIPFIKVWGILPMAILFTALFTFLTHRYGRQKVFNIMMGIFLSFFALFTFVLYPARDSLHPHAWCDHLQTLLPLGFKGLIALLRNWSFTLYYIMSDLWSTAILTVLFWGFANEVTNVKEAKRFYGLLSLGGNFTAILSGQVSILFSGSYFFSFIPYGKVPWEQSVLFLNVAVIFCGVLTMLIFRWLHRNVPLPVQEQKKDLSVKVSILESLKLLGKSKYLIYIASIVFMYNLTENLIEIVWKNQMKQLFPLPGAYSSYMGQVMTVTGIIATLVSLLLTGNILRRFSWTYGALIPPVISLITGGLFFSFVLFPNSPLAGIAVLLGWTPLFLSVTMGSLQNCIARASKYTLFDATKELAFIPLDQETKRVGKAAIDGVGSRLGKSGGSLIHQGFLLVFTTLAASAPCIGIIFFGAAIIWGFSVVSLGKKFDSLVARVS
jgi:AAA family ATP:ADP antiporter